MNDKTDRPCGLNGHANGSPVSFWLKRAAQYSADLYADHLGKTGLTQRQFTVLKAVQANEGGSQTDVVRNTGIDRSTLADLVNRLESQGYLRRQRSQKDARVNYVFLTKAGKAVLKDAKPLVGLVDTALVNELPEDKQAAFIEALEMLSNKLDAAD